MVGHSYSFNTPRGHNRTTCETTGHFPPTVPAPFNTLHIRPQDVLQEHQNTLLGLYKIRRFANAETRLRSRSTHAISTNKNVGRKEGIKQSKSNLISKRPKTLVAAKKWQAMQSAEDTAHRSTMLSSK